MHHPTPGTVVGVIAIVAPGQGAQTPGFLAPWLEIDSFAARLTDHSQVTGLDLAHLGTQADAETIRDTAIAQPLLVSAGLSAAAELVQGELVPGVVAGHSVGEITAAALAGVLSEQDALVFVRERARGMAEASALRPTSMTAVVGGDPAEVLAAIERQGLTPANNNGSGQIVAAGTVEQLETFAQEPPARARLFPLSVAGAFHTAHMAPAQDRLRALAADLTTSEPTATLLSNRDGRPVDSGREFLDRLVSQVTSPVRWDLCMETLRSLGVTGLLELTPAGTLVGIAKRNLKGIELFSLNTPDQLDDARAFVAAHSANTNESEPVR